MNKIFALFIFTFFWNCSNTDSIKSTTSSYLTEIKEKRSEKNKEFLKDGSPIPANIRKNFLGLNYFPIDSQFKISAAYIPQFDLKLVEFKTNTERSPKYIAFAQLVFGIKGQTDTLLAYKDATGKSQELFVPFTDLTNGSRSYSTGRYLDLEIPENDSLILDFNLAYNPYCAYSKKYSCPIPPATNHLEIEILAGEAKFNEH